MKMRPIPDPLYYVKLQLAFGMNSDVTQINREVYNSFMLLGDVGGFSGLLLSAGAFIVGLFTHNNPENFLAKNLYVPYNRQDFAQAGKKIEENELNPTKQYAFKEYL